MNYIIQYDVNMTEGKGNNKNIVAGYKCKFYASVNLLRELKANYLAPLFHMVLKTKKRLKSVR